MRIHKITHRKLNLDICICTAFALLLMVRLTGDFLPFNLVVTVLLVFGLILFRYLNFNSIIFSRLSVINIVNILFFSHILITYFFSDSPEYGFRKLYLLFPIILAAYLYKYYLAKNYYVIGRSIAFIVGATAITAPLYISASAVVSILTNPVGGRLGLTENTNVIVIATFFSIGLIHILQFVNISLSKLAIKNIYSFVKAGLLLVLIFLITILLFFTGSRGVQLAVILAYFSYFIFQKKYVYNYLVPAGFIFFLLSILLALIDIQRLILNLTPEWSHMFIERRFFNELASKSINARYELYSTAWQGVLNSDYLSFLFGNGIGDFSYFAVKRDFRLYPHNIQLEIFYEMGLIGLLSFTLMTLFPFYVHRKMRLVVSQFSAIFISYYFFLFRSLSTADIAGNFCVFVYLFIIMGLYTLHRRELL